MQRNKPSHAKVILIIMALFTIAKILKPKYKQKIDLAIVVTMDMHTQWNDYKAAGAGEMAQWLRAYSHRFSSQHPQ